MPKRVKLGIPEFRVLSLYIDYLSFEEVGREIGMTRQGVRDRIMRHGPILLREAGIEWGPDLQYTLIAYRSELLDYIETRIRQIRGKTIMTEWWRQKKESEHAR